MTGYGTSSTIKIKWKRRSQTESHSDESLWKLFKKFGQITSVELIGAKVSIDDDDNDLTYWKK